MLVFFRELKRHGFYINGRLLMLVTLALSAGANGQLEWQYLPGLKVKGRLRGNRMAANEGGGDQGPAPVLREASGNLMK